MKVIALVGICLLQFTQQQCFRTLGTVTNQQFIDTATEPELCRVDKFDGQWDLIFSDEFSVPRSIDFDDKDEVKWLANNGLNFLSKDFCTDQDAVKIQDGHLRLEVIAQDSTCYEPFSGEDVSKTYIAGGVETWNKFCFTGGYIEIDIKLSKNYFQYGELFVQLYGNLFRIGRFDQLYDWFAGWDYSTCELSSSNDFDAWGASFAQHISACPNDANAKKYGVPQGIGRGAQTTIIGQLKPIFNNTDYNLAVDLGATFRPVSPPDVQDTIANLTQAGISYNSEFVGPVDIEDVSSPRYRQAQLSQSETQDVYKAIGLFNFKENIKLGLWWEPGEFLRWYVDDDKAFEINKTALEAYTREGHNVGQRLVSEEASYINLFLDARNMPEETSEFPGDVYADIDYVRVYQQKEKTGDVTCNPTQRPTQPIIDALAGDFYYPVERQILEEQKRAGSNETSGNESSAGASGKDDRSTLIIATVVAVVVVLCVAVVGFQLYRMLRRRQRLLAKQHESPYPQGGDYHRRLFNTDSQQTPNTTRTTMNSQSNYIIPQNIQGLTLFEPLGSGSFGKVYRGKWKGFQVAVKVQCHMNDASTEKIKREAELSLKMKHPNVVQTYYHSIVHRDHVEVDRLLHDSTEVAQQRQQMGSEVFYTPKETVNVGGSMGTPLAHTPIEWGSLGEVGGTNGSGMYTPQGTLGATRKGKEGGKPFSTDTAHYDSQAEEEAAEHQSIQDTRDTLLDSNESVARAAGKMRLSSEIQRGPVQVNLRPARRSRRKNGADGQGSGGSGSSSNTSNGAGSVGDSVGSVGDTEKRLRTSTSHADQHETGRQSQSSSVAEIETWIVQELCDLGAMNPTNVRKLMHENGAPKLDVILETAMDIARGMEYLHLDKITHGDLKATNVLLQTAGGHHNKFVAKVADFGLSRKLKHQQTATRTVGTVTHMPPELLMQGLFSFKGDVYAFGIILWELAHAKYPYHGLTQGQIITHLITNNERPTFEVDIVPEYIELTKRCWDKDPQMRPTFVKVREELEHLKIKYFGPLSLYNRQQQEQGGGAQAQ